MRKCRKCGAEKRGDDFPQRAGRLRWTCRACDNARQRSLWTTEKGREYKRSQYARDPDFKTKLNLKTLYGMTLADYAAILANQGGGCAICGSTDPRNRQGAKRFHVDHDHETHEVRGLLCGNCNAGLGRFKDNPELLTKAASYLAQPRPHGHRARVSQRWDGKENGYVRHR